ncbi:MAG: TRAP transporter small permease [Proteobacteria bacterium]|nr:TRAP transporter small permease [Pseudomonadota bacterium]
MARLQTVAEWLARWGARAGGYLIAATAVLVTADVALRKLFSVTFRGADEISGYAFIIGTTWALAFTLFRKGHIRIDVVYARLPCGAQAALDVLALLALMAYVGPLTYFGVEVLTETLRVGAQANTPLRTALWMPQGLWVVGLVFFCLCLLLVLVRATVGLARRDIGLVRRIAGAAAHVDEVEAEIGEPVAPAVGPGPEPGEGGPR